MKLESNLPSLSKFQENLIRCLEPTTGRVRQCIANSLRHMEKANEIREIDQEMAAFRLITAEEEAATALFFVTKNLRYPRSDRIRFTEHKFKLGLFPFLIAVNRHIGQFESQLPPINFRIKETEGYPRLVLQIQVQPDLVAEPIPPLNFSMINATIGRKVDFTKEFTEIAENDGHRDVKKLLESIAKVRNTLLYANESGISKIENSFNELLENVKGRVFTILMGVALIFPYDEHVLFVQQLLDSFLLALDTISEEEFNW